MNRRSFLGLLAGFALDPERLLWRPGQRLISIPAPFLTARVLTAFVPRQYMWAIRFDVVQSGRPLVMPTDTSMIDFQAHYEKISAIEARRFACQFLPESAVPYADDCIRLVTERPEVHGIHYSHYPADLIPPSLHSAIPIPKFPLRFR